MQYLVFQKKKKSRVFGGFFVYPQAWKYSIRRSANSDFSNVTMRRVAIIFFELGDVKNFMQIHDYLFV